MKNIFIIVCLLWVNVAFGTTYYVSNEGNDSNSGTSENSAWASIQKVQSSMGSFNSGDIVLFEKGGLYRGSLNITVSGLTIGAYGVGNKPVISGSKVLDEFGQSGNIWSITDSELPENENNLHSLFIDGEWHRLGRYPDAGFLYFDSYSGNSQITDNDINFSSGYWNGAECVTRTMHYIYDRLTVSSYSNGVFNFSESATYNFGQQGSENNGYIIQNHDNTLSINGEWNYSSTNRTLKVYYNSNLNNHTVEMPAVTYGIYVSANNVTIRNIEVSYFERATFFASATSGLKIENVTSKYSNYFFIRSGRGDATIESCDVSNMFSEGINTDDFNMTIINNNFENIGHVVGLDDGGFGYRGIYVESGNQVIQKNKLKNIGYHGIAFYFSVALIDSNYIDGFNNTLSDGGAIYCYKTTNSGSRISRNIILNGGNPDDGGAWHPGIGLYQDNQSSGAVWEYNTLINVDFPYKANETLGGTMRYNKAYNVGELQGQYPHSFGINLAFKTQSNFNFNNNIVVGNENLNQVWWVWTSGISFSNCNFDYNYYISPWANQAQLFRTPSGYYSLSAWKSSNPFDNSWEDNTKGTPIQYSSNEKFEDKVVVFYNATEKEVSYVLDPAWKYIDIDGNEANGTVVVPGFNSAVYFKNGVGSGNVSVTGLQLNPDNVTMDMNTSQTLTAVVSPTNATNKKITWTSEDNNVVQVNSNGIISAINPGTTRIIATTDDGNFTANCSVTVDEINVTVDVTGIAISSDSETLIEGNTIALSANVIPENATNQAIVWSSNNEEVASVNSSGIVSAISEGVAYITVRSVEGEYTETCIVTVKAGKSGDVVTGISVSPNDISFKVGESQQLLAQSLPGDIGGITYTFKSNNSNIASVDANGVVKALAPGQTTIVVSISGTEFTDDVNVTVIDNTKSGSENILKLDEENVDGNSGAYVQTTNITGWHEGDYISWENVDLNNVTAIRVKYSSPNDSRTFSIRLDSETGPILVAGTINSTGTGEYDYATVVFYLEGSSNYGFRDVYFVGDYVNGIYLDFLEIVYNVNTSSNASPIVSIDYDESAYSGTVKTLDASDSFDPEGDKLTYQWSAPDGVDISSDTGSLISFIVPDTYYPVKKEFNLKVSDGTHTVDRNIEITFTPYKPELSKVNVVKVAASYYDGQNHPVNLLDGDPSTYWSAKGDNHWVSMELSKPTKLSHLKVAFFGVNDKKSNFDIFVSNDENNWESLAEELESCGFSSTLHLFTCNQKSTLETTYRYVKITGHGTDIDDNNKLSEIEIYGDVASSTSELFEEEGFKIYPNPCSNAFFVELQDCVSFEILDVQGRVLKSYQVQEGENEIYHDLPSGIYLGRAMYKNDAYHLERFIVK